MNLLREYIRELLVEKSLTGRKLERVAKSIANSVTQALKDEDIKEIFKSRDEIKFSVRGWKKPKALTWLRMVDVTLIASEKFNSSAAYEYSIDAPPEERENSDLLLKLYMPQDYTDAEVDRFRVKFLGAIRHELEHSGQSTKILRATQRKIPDEDAIWASLESIEEYYVDEAETPAHAADWVLQAKEEGLEAADVIDRELNNLWHTALEKGFTEDELHPVINRIRDIYQFYLMTRWPEQDWPVEMRD